MMKIVLGVILVLVLGALALAPRHAISPIVPAATSTPLAAPVATSSQTVSVSVAPKILPPRAPAVKKVSPAPVYLPIPIPVPLPAPAAAPMPAASSAPSAVPVIPAPAPTPATSSTPTTTPAIPGDAVLLYPFDRGDQNGMISTDTVGGNNATAVTVQSFVPGVRGDALAFNGQGDMLAVPRTEAVDLTVAPITIAFWVKLNDLASYQSILSQNTSSSRLILAYSPATGIALGSGYLSGNFVEQGNAAAWNASWHHVALVSDANFFTLYFDGMPAGHASRPNYTILTGGALWIGADKYSSNARDFLNGALDDFRVYARALSASEIVQLATK